MADWQSIGSDNDGVAVPQVVHQDANTSFKTTALTGTLNKANEANFKDKAQEAGWVSAVPVNYNLKQSRREDRHRPETVLCDARPTSRI